MMKRTRLSLVFITLTLALLLTLYGTYHRYSNLQNTMEIQQSIFQLVELKSANAQWDFELNQIHSNNFPHFDLVNQAAVKYQEELAQFLQVSANIKGPVQTISAQLVPLALLKKEKMNDYLSDVAVTRNSLKFLDTQLFTFHSLYENDEEVHRHLAHAQYKLSIYVALNQNLILKQRAYIDGCDICTPEQNQIINKVNRHLSFLKERIMYSHQAKEAFYYPKQGQLLNQMFDELSSLYVKEENKHQTIQGQILTIACILVITVIALLGLLYLIYRTYDDHKKAGITDPLTGLYNRKKLFDNLSKFTLSHEKSNKKLALLFIDLDGFKGVNDNFGHDIGDKLLQRLSARLNHLIRNQSSIYRIGGDEFVILLQELRHIDEAISIAETLSLHCNEPYHLADNMCKVTLSVGISVYPDHSLDGKTLIKYADEAMYMSKNKGKSQVSVWTNE
ncbi:hypothetical protein A9Q77_00835 [Marinomonas sp. 42_23_T18]|nr:hypothetical protein A9Q77_00835 [Marinomonas sp. 42_23_T18]